MTAVYSRHAAANMGTHPATTVPRRLGSLGALYLHYLQFQLTRLETELMRRTIPEAKSEDEEMALYYRDWQALAKSRASNSECSDWLKLVLRASRKLDEYGEY